MYRIVLQLVAYHLAIAAAGCSSPSPQSSPESLRDPLGIDRAVNDYYFPDAVPETTENNVDVESAETSTAGAEDA